MLLADRWQVDFRLLILCCVHAKSLQSCPILCNPMDCRLSGSSVHGILQARVLEWVAMTSSRRSSRPRGRTCISSASYTGRGSLAPVGKPPSPTEEHYSVVCTKCWPKSLRWWGTHDTTAEMSQEKDIRVQESHHQRQKPSHDVQQGYS